MTGADLLVERGDGLMVLTLNRPEARNAIHHALAVQIEAALDAFETDDELAVAIVTGAGGTFCSGMDLKSFARGEPVPRTDKRGFAGIAALPPMKPIIAAVEGYALAGGFEIVLACDLVVAAENATFGLPEVTRGLCATAGGMFRLPDRIPYHEAMKLLLTGDFLDARRAAQLGLVAELTEPGAALATAHALAARIAANAPLAVEATKRVVVESRDWPNSDRLRLQAPVAEAIRGSDDAKEGARAFAEKRAPVWRRA